VSTAVLVFPDVSKTVIVIVCVPAEIGIDADHDVVPLAEPLPPALFVHVTVLTPALSEEVPATVSGVEVAVHVPPPVGEVIDTVGGVVSPAGGV